MTAHLWLPQAGNLLSTLLEDILVVEPDTLLVGELSTGLRALGDIEEGYQLVKQEQLLFRAWVPTQQS